MTQAEMDRIVAEEKMLAELEAAKKRKLIGFLLVGTLVVMILVRK